MANLVRNNLVVELYEKGYSGVEIQKELKDQGYPPISRFRIWSIYKNSSLYKSKRSNLVFCNFCLINKPAQDLYKGFKVHNYKAKFRMCKDCLNRLQPDQPIKQEQNA